MFEFHDNEMGWEFTKSTPIEKMLDSIKRAKKSMEREDRPDFKRWYNGYISGMELAIMVLEQEERELDLKMELFLDEGPF